MNTNVRPQDDFFHYAGGGWLAKNPIPKEESRWGSFTKLRKTVAGQLHTLALEMERKKKVVTGSPEQLIRDFIRSGMDIERRKTLGITPIKKHLALIDSIKTREELVPTIAKLEKIGGDGVWGTMVEQDVKNSEKYRLYLYQGGLGLPDRDYYLNDDKESKRVRDAYKAYVVRLMKLAGVSKDPQADMETMYALEEKLAELSMRKEDTREVDKTYFNYTISKLQKLTPSIPWATYLKLIGADVKDVVVMQPKFFAGVSKLMKSVSLEDWKTYLRLQLVIDFSSNLSPALEKETFGFYGTTLSGVTHPQPLWRRVLGVVNGGFGELFGKLYVERHFSPDAKKEMLEMIEDLFTAYKARIQNLEWMGAATKKKALKKLSQIVPKIGYPDTWKTYKGVRIDADDFVGNILRISAWHDRRQLAKLKKKTVDRSEWFMYPQTVNAYYNPGINDIVFPAGILQPPFFSTSFDSAINYGAIGTVIGHEITHAFDDQGSKFDGYGNRKTWWTPEDRKRFDAKAKVLVNQFNQYTVADGVKVNGQLTLGENIADLGGISIAYDAYQLKLERTGRKDIGGFTPEQRFFLGASFFERENSRPEFQKMQVTTDPHSPALFRINGPFSNLPEFYEAFGVKKSDKLYRSPTTRAKIW